LPTSEGFEIEGSRGVDHEGHICRSASKYLAYVTLLFPLSESDLNDFSPLTMSSNVSFTIRRPTPVSRATSSGPESDPGSSFKVPPLPPPSRGSPLVRSQTSSPHPQTERIVDSSDEDSAAEDELVTGFDRFGVQRCVSFVPRGTQCFQLTIAPARIRLSGKKKVSKPLVIPALKNKDWREVARKRRNATQYVPPSAAAVTGADGSVGGLGTKDTINSGPVLSGLQIKNKVVSVTQDEDVAAETLEVAMEVVEETEDQKALRAILAESSGETQRERVIMDIIQTPISETDALKQDVNELPDTATLEDYARVPVSQFGAALLRGMGWKEGTAASRKPGKGLVEPYLPSARPALLGIGAKEQEVFDDGSKKKNAIKRPERRYMPIIKQDRADTASPNGNPRDRRERSRSPRRSATSSRRNSPDRYNIRSEKDRSSSRRGYSNVDDKEMDRPRAEYRDRRRDDDWKRDYDRESRRDDDRDRRRDDERDRSDKNRDDSRRRDY